MKFLKTHRFDQSDGFAFELAAEPGEWAVPGAFMFSGRDPDELEPKERLAMRQGFLGLESLGWSSFVIITSIEQAMLDQQIDRLAKLGVERLGAPTLAASKKAAAHEIEFALSLCEHPNGTVLRVEREPGPMGWHEAFRTIKLPADMHAPVFEIISDDQPDRLGS